MSKWVYRFDDPIRPDKMLLGGKGANLVEMTQAGLPVPPGFTLTTQLCGIYQAHRNLPEDVYQEVEEAIQWLEERTGKTFGGADNPLLVSVRSGAPISMPGMMDTILNLGLNPTTVEGLARRTQNRRFALDSYRRFIQMFADVVLGVPIHRFERQLESARRRAGVETDQQLDADALADIVHSYLDIVEHETGRPFPDDPRQQLRMAIGAVYASWDNDRAKVYRKVSGIPDSLGTAVNVQSMVFGNMGDDSGTGVAFTRNPSTGEPGVFGEYLMNAQGEDVVAGIRTPQPIQQLAQEMPDVYEQFIQVCEQLEAHFQDVQDIEFTVERGRLYLLQTRAAKRTPEAAVRIAVDLVEEGRIDRATALKRVNPATLSQLLHMRMDESATVTELAKGLPASPGAASGRIVFTADDAKAWADRGEKVILVRTETTPEDIHGILAAEGILTSRGGMTSHAAVVARGMGKPCVCGCDTLRINPRDKTLQVGERVLAEGDVMSIDGASGRVFLGDVPRVAPKLSDHFQKLLSWADETRRLGVRANADTPEDAQRARELGAEGIGLCRTEHMFMHPERVPVVQRMILAATQEERQRALDQLLPMQEDDFYGILKAMDGLPVTIRLLDPPLHEFLPNLEKLIARQASLRTRRSLVQGGQEVTEVDAELADVEQMLAQVRALHELNPMLGHRGCRLGITFPEVYEMQVRAIFQAAARLVSEGLDPRPEVMIPLVGHVEELRRMRSLVIDTAQAVLAERGVKVPVSVGTMIEVPRAALTADQIATEAEFFSFGTNDLTQTTFGFSRDDAEGKFLHQYVDEGILPENPFAVLDEDGVGQLVKLGVERGRSTRPSLKTGICGEHGGDPASIRFCHNAGLDYVSCSPFRVPVARLAAAQAALS
ncbi:MAG: pyruvate, phosphate dikinase [Alicyclobacillus herbarius]|uniref:pyruvate, phosphate dikinase n=1 Tax=Alicyclobacillus herbarius TaxID=122960 RepID=UPI0023526504|nr:pyruvate, phosphate dikinase [Alicyclobacillus herbarius]MCL6633261.1 pyruvate, phosphate dikinase [Alicyclobacillus herbarius]